MNTNTLPAIVDRTWKFKKGSNGVQGATSGIKKQVV